MDIVIIVAIICVIILSSVSVSLYFAMTSPSKGVKAQPEIEEADEEEEMDKTVTTTTLIPIPFTTAPKSYPVGRYVRIEANGLQILHVNQIEVYDEKGDLIPPSELKGSVGPGTYTSNWDGSLLLDGKKVRSAQIDGIAHTPVGNGLGVEDAFLQVDLGKDRPVSKVLVFNRSDCCQSRISGSFIRLRDSSMKLVKEYQIIGPQKEYSVQY